MSWKMYVSFKSFARNSFSKAVKLKKQKNALINAHVSYWCQTIRVIFQIIEHALLPRLTANTLCLRIPKTFYSHSVNFCTKTDEGERHQSLKFSIEGFVDYTS